MPLRLYSIKTWHRIYIDSRTRFFSGQPALSFFTGNLEAAYYNAIAFIVLFIIAKILLRIIGSFLSIVAGIPVIKQINQMLGAVLGFLEVYLFTFVFAVCRIRSAGRCTAANDGAIVSRKCDH